MFECCCGGSPQSHDVSAAVQGYDLSSLDVSSKKGILNFLDQLAEINPDYNSYEGPLYIEFKRVAVIPDETRLVGWKFHISISQAQIFKAATIIIPILINEGVTDVKFYAPEDLESMNNKIPGIKSETLGKEFTIFSYLNPEKNWSKIIKEMEVKLRENGIMPLETASGTFGCTQIPGSMFFSYRCDQRPLPEGQEHFYYLDESITDQEKYQERMNLIYISEKEAVQKAKSEGTETYNPYNLPVPQFIIDTISTMTEYQNGIACR